MGPNTPSNSTHERMLYSIYFANITHSPIEDYSDSKKIYPCHPFIYIPRELDGFSLYLNRLYSDDLVNCYVECYPYFGDEDIDRPFPYINVKKNIISTDIDALDVKISYLRWNDIAEDDDFDRLNNLVSDIDLGKVYD